MNQKIKCFFGFHKERILGSELPYYQQVLLKCDGCGKYNLWHRGIGIDTGWKKSTDGFPRIVKEHIKEHNL
jgi:hypothetical protein